MPENIDELELKARLNLIETMIAEGRCSTGKWGWSFVLWGVAYFVAFAWADWGHSSAAWPVTIVAAGILTGVLAARRRQGEPSTAIGRAIGSIWKAMGIALCVLIFSLAFSGRLNDHVSVAVVGAMLALANGASSLILRWKMQLACAVVWLAAAEVACFGSLNECLIAFLAATFFCQIVFGIYAMIYDTRIRGQRSAIHA